MDLYDVLGVDPDATHDELRTAFRMRVRALHPDHGAGGGDDHTAVTSITEAWHVLGDPGRRASYDASGINGVDPPPRDRAPAAASAPSSALLRRTFLAFSLFVVVVTVVLFLVAFTGSG